MSCVFVVFFFKQKTAYEMRISDWSSDVCSSDLRTARRDGEALPAHSRERAAAQPGGSGDDGGGGAPGRSQGRRGAACRAAGARLRPGAAAPAERLDQDGARRGRRRSAGAGGAAERKCVG